MNPGKDGGAAFPAELSSSGPQEGMSLRDYFAAKAMQAYIQWGVWYDEYGPSWCYTVADAMLEERNK